MISPLIKDATGWTLLPVSGFLDEELFFEINKKRQFPVTDIIRRSPRFDEKYSGTKITNKKGYTPEPDIFHDVQAHVPFLMNEQYADFMWQVGVVGDEIIKDKRELGPDLISHNLRRLQNFAWWTYEYGLIKNMGDSDHLRRLPNDIDFEIYGAGIISSLDEVNNIIECAKGISSNSKFLPYDIEDYSFSGKIIRVKLAGIDDRNQSEELVKCLIVVNRRDLPELSPNSYYWRDLIGFEVHNEDNLNLGILDSFFETGSNDVMIVIGSNKNRMLIPFINVEVVKKVDLKKKIISVDWNDGE